MGSKITFLLQAQAHFHTTWSCHVMFLLPNSYEWKIFVARMVQRQLRVWLLQDVCLWTCSWCYTIFCSLYVSLFIANLNGQDHWRLGGEIQRSRERNLWWIELSPPIWGTCFLHPLKQTWNPKMKVWKMFLLFQGGIFRFHVCFQGCKFLFANHRKKHIYIL